MTPLSEILCRRTAATGPITIAEYMAECLLHPTQGYYTTREVFGQQGDFITAPEISQMFGELIGLCLAQAWMDQGSPPAVVLAELGPGRGTLMADLLRATRSVPGFHAAVQLHLVEASPRLRDIQATALMGASPVWHDSLASLPELPIFVIANEFFDALPIRQFQRSATGWHERQVTCSDQTLCLGLGPEILPPFLAHRLSDTAPGDLVEHCPGAGPILTELARRVGQSGGAALIIDYGDWRSLGDTLQALRQHQPDDPFLNPGLADLTAHVDFEALTLAATATGAAIACSPMTPQGVFLERLGITARAQTLARNMSAQARALHVAAHRRLTHPDEMGSLFKCLAITPTAAPPLSGLVP